MLDQAGRLQVPRAYLEEWGIGTRADLEMTEDGILIKPINGKPSGEAGVPRARRGREPVRRRGPAPAEPPAPNGGAAVGAGGSPRLLAPD